MEPIAFLDGRVTLYPGDCIGVLAGMEENSVDSVVTDPPYHLTSIVKRFGADGAAEAKEGATGAYKRASAGFMGKQWDGGDIAFRVETWQAVLRVLKPGGYLLAFASTRGFGEMSVAISGAGFNTHPLTAFITAHPDAQEFLASLDRDQFDAFLRLLDHNDLGGMLGWIFGSGFPKATRIKAEGYDGFRYGGQALKPAIEPIYMGQKPFSEENGTANILRHGTGALNIDACRIGEFVNTTPPGTDRFNARAHELGYRPNAYGRDGEASAERRYTEQGSTNFAATPGPRGGSPSGRWPANVITDGSEEVLAAFPDNLSSGTGAIKKATGAGTQANAYGKESCPAGTPNIEYGDTGSASRFFYSAKADAEDRIGSKHPTVKRVDLKQYLCRLITPPGGTVLDLFAGTGTTGEAAWREGFKAILIEREPEYQADIARRMDLVLKPTERAAVAKAKGKLQGAEGTPLFGFEKVA